MNLFKKSLLLVLLVGFALTANAQNQTAKVTPGGIWYYEYLPADYNSNTDDYPIVFFMHGMGERGNTEADLFKVAINGPPKHVKNGHEFPFILISPQLHTSKTNWPPWFINDVVEHVKTTGLRIDLNRLYVTGLSLGGGGAWFFAKDYPEKIAALAPICGSSVRVTEACNLANVNMPVWAFHGDADGVVNVNKTISMVNAINACVPAPDPLALMTIYPGVGHNAWTRAYRTDNSLHTPNIYEWMLSHSKSNISADAGDDVTILLPTSTTSLTGSGTSDAAITNYLWELASGPAVTLANETTSTVTVSGLAAGVYTMRLTVTDANGDSDSDEVTITVNASNAAPTANAGSDKTIKLPVNSVSVTGSGSDSDGTVVSYAWTQISGPAATISDQTSAFINITNMAQGVHVFQLTVTDNFGATGTDEVTVTVNEADNVGPTSNAGPDRTLNLPTNTINITGSGSDSDGTIASYLWQRVAGPPVTLTNADQPTVTASNIVFEGTYYLRLTVTDDDGATDRDDMTITVSAANQSPTVNAGTDQNITQPTSTANLSGSASDADGTIASYLWESVSGPSTPSITNATQSSCSVSGMTSVGNYVFRLTATDDDGATAIDEVTVVVNSAPVNEDPVANAGTDQNITLPTNSVALSGSATDLDGTISSYAWTKISGGTATLGGASTATLTASNLVAGTYVFRLTVTDNDGGTGTDDVTVTVNPAAVNESPTADAGADQVVLLPVASVVFSGSAVDNDGTIASFAWTQLSGPALTLSGASTASLTVTSVVEGVYTFELEVTDDDGATDSDIVMLTANTTNSPPVANAGADQSITLPVSSHVMMGSATDSDGTIASYQWSQISGPNQAAFSGAVTQNLSVSNMIAGLYTFRLTVTDDDGATHFDEANLTVNAALNDSPTANAGTDQTIQLPTNSLNVVGFATDTDGTIASTVWSYVSGPNVPTFANENTLTVTASNMIEGVYTFQLTVTDDDGAIDFDQVDITVLAAVANSLPTANAGANQTITLPTNTSTLNGSGTDTDGSIASYAWTKTSGPGATLSNANTPNLSLSDLVEGNYTFRLTVTDNVGGQGTDEASVSVLPATVNEPPVSNAGADIQLILPANAVNIVGSASDPDGTVTDYLWTKTSGPAATMTNTDNPTLSLSNLLEGSYVFDLTVTDNDGATASDEVTVTVLPEIANSPPTANAGADVSITLPTNTLNIGGSGSDTDGTIVRYTWTKTSGPAATLTNDDAATLTVSDLLEGTYTFRLEVEDDAGDTDQDVMTLQVFPEAVNTSPTANAGSDQNIQLPTNSVVVNGSASDSDGTIASTEWTKVSGGAATISDPASTNTTINDMVEGTYVFRLTATDDDGATGSDELTVEVLAATANVPPIAGAGADQTISLPTNSIVIQGSASDADGTVASILWTKTGGPTATLVNETTDALTANDLLEGVYTFRITVTDNDGETDSDEVNVTVLAASVNTAPNANIGGDLTIQLPDNGVDLTVTITDDGAISTIDWVVDSSPAAPTLTGNGTETLSLSNLVEGVYQLHVTVTDDGGLTDTDNVTVTVLAENVAGNMPPTVDAGEDLTINETEATITALADDPDGVIRDFTWTQVNGPSTATITQGLEGVVTFSNLNIGRYTFNITVSDFDDAIASDEIIIEVVESLSAIQAPMVFSPNGDNINDFWSIGNKDVITGCTVIIFDRKGSIVFESVGYEEEWDGTRNGERLPEGVYYYVIRCDGNKNDKTGSITLLR